MADILAFGEATQSTSAAGIPSAYDQLAPNGVTISTYQSVQQILTNPTFSGITSLTPQLNGSLLASWGVATTPNPVIEYDVYIQLSTATGLFSSPNKAKTIFGTADYIFALADGTILVSGSTYYVGIRARDPLGNQSTNTSSIAAVSVGVQPSRALAPTDIPAIVAAVWDELAASHISAGTFGSNLDAKVSLRATQASVNAIPTNPLLTTDSRLNTLDANISTRATQTSITALDTKLGTPAGISVSADVAAVKSDTGTTNSRVDVVLSTRATQTSVTAIDTKLGTPAGASVSADVAAVQADTDDIQSKIGTPVSTVSADIAAVKGDTGATNTTVNTINTKIGTPTGVSVSADVAAVKADTASIDTKVDVTLSTRATQASVNLIPTNPLLTTDSRLNNLDATISSRASAAQVAAIQNNTSFVGIVPNPLLLPETGSKDYPIYVRLFDGVGAPQDPDLNQMYLSIKDAAGATVVASTLMTKDAVGQYSYDYTVLSTDTQQALYAFFDYVENSVAFNQVRATEVVEFESKLDTLLSRLTPTRASNLDNLDVVVSTRATQTSITALDTKLGTPAGASVSIDIAAVKSDTTTTNTRVDVVLSTRATQASVTALDTKLGTPAGASVSDDIAAVQTTADSIDGKVDVAVSTRASQTSVDAIPTAAENADAVWDEDVNAHATGTTTARTLKDAKIFSQIDL